MASEYKTALAASHGALVVPDLHRGLNLAFSRALHEEFARCRRPTPQPRAVSYNSGEARPLVYLPVKKRPVGCTNSISVE